MVNTILDTACVSLSTTETCAPPATRGRKKQNHCFRILLMVALSLVALNLC